MKIYVKAFPNSKVEKVELSWQYNWLDLYIIKFKQKPIKWLANKYLINILSKYFNKSKSFIEILSWEKSNFKKILIN